MARPNVTISRRLFGAPARFPARPGARSLPAGNGVHRSWSHWFTRCLEGILVRRMWRIAGVLRIGQITDRTQAALRARDGHAGLTSP